jgi:hypothetical protein
MQPAVMVNKKSAAADTRSNSLLTAFNRASNDSTMPDAASSGAQKRDASASPYKEKMDELKKLRASTVEGSAGSSDAPNPILDAIEAVSKKLDKMALKTDLDELESKITSNVKLTVAEAVEPLQTEIDAVKTEMTALKARLETVEAHPPTSATPCSEMADKTLKELRSAVNSLDPAHRRAAFLGWPEGVSASERITHMKTFMTSKFPNYHVSEYLNHYTGPYNDRKMGTVSFC